MDSEQDTSAPDSKTQRKKAMIELQQLGERLLQCKAGILQSLPLSDHLRQALAEYKRIPNSHEAKRRQLQYIGRLMRGNDHEAILAALDKADVMDRLAYHRQQQLEKMCSRVLDEGDTAIQQLLDDFPQLDRQVLRQAHREYLKAQEHKLPQIRSRLLSYLDGLTRLPAAPGTGH
ncbi:MAG: hypothetical protein RLZZ385_450 [Pseudomonadota bacterium]|jgi:ribosome-associated protein